MYFVQRSNLIGGEGGAERVRPSAQRSFLGTGTHVMVYSRVRNNLVLNAILEVIKNPRQQ